MMGHPLQLVLHIMVIFALEQLRMLFADMHRRLNTMYLEGSDGIAMAYLFNMKLIRLWESLIKDKFYRWE